MSGEWERRKSLRASGGRLGNGRSGELKGNTWPGSEQGLETDRDTEGWGGENVAGRGTLSHNVIISCFCFAMTFCFSVCPTSFSCVFRIQRGILLLHYVDSIFRMTWVSSVKNISIISVSLHPCKPGCREVIKQKAKQEREEMTFTICEEKYNQTHQ